MVFLAIKIDNLDLIFSIIGSISANAIGLTLPALFYVKLTKKKEINYFLSIIIIIISILLGILCIIAE